MSHKSCISHHTHTVFVLAVLVSLLSCCRVQAHTFTATVIDAQTQQPLPFASVFIKHGASTITNSQGAFAIHCDSTDVMRISYVGYRSVNITAGNLPAVVSLQAVESMVDEVVILPVDLKKFIQKTTKETLRQMQKNRKQKANFFYRQIGFVQKNDSLPGDSVCNEVLEAFLTGCPAVSLSQLELLKGRYAAIAPDSTTRYAYYRNFYTFSEIEVASKFSQPGNTIVPLFRNWKTYYDVDYDVAFDESGSRLIVLLFKPKPHIERGIMACAIYVDEQTFHIRRIVGRGLNSFLSVEFMVLNDEGQPTKHRWIFPTSFAFQVNMTEERGFVEVQSVFINQSHRFDGNRICTNSLLYNVGNLQELSEQGMELEYYGHLHDFIDAMGYDPTFWRDNEIVLRTPVEQNVMDLFESKRLFGVWK